jgi:hypothetical protein
MYVDRLVTDGFVVIEGALDPTFCEQVVRQRITTEGWDDTSTWPVGPVHLPATTTFPLDHVAPAAADALRHLVGAAEACLFRDIPDNLIVNFPDPTASPSSAERRADDPEGWHKDGDWFRHFLDSPEQGLLGIVLWRDVTLDMGPTCVASDSIGPMAELLATHPEGFDPAELKAPVREILAGCHDIRPLTGAQGTMVFGHPFLLHTASTNTSATPRVISNTTVMLNEPMRFDRPDDDYTDVERSILAVLGVDRIDLTITGERGQVVSERERRWADGTSAGG